jgi:G3E family GTPase
VSRVPVTILTGFLGSGKTTRLNALLRAPHGRRVAVIMNEIGAVGIEAARLAAPGEFVELEGGCLCCQLNADLEATLHRLRARGGFDHLVVETTGLADPLPVAWTFERTGLRDGFRVDAIVTVVDARELARARAATPEVDLQIERADVVLVSKLDVAGGGLDAVTAVVRALNPVAPILPAPRDATPWAFLLDVAAGTPRAAPAPVPHARDAGWEHWAWRSPALVSEGALDDFLRALPPGVWRVKGLVRLDAGGWATVHAVGGRYEVEPCAPSPEPAEGVLLCIGRGLDRADLDARAAALVA